jgi:hypothetical protein
MQPRRAKKRVYNSSGLNHLRRYGPVCDESLPYPAKALRKLRHPSRSRKLKAFVDGVKDM